MESDQPKREDPKIYWYILDITTHPTNQIPINFLVFQYEYEQLTKVR